MLSNVVKLINKVNTASGALDATALVVRNYFLNNKVISATSPLMAATEFGNASLERHVPLRAKTRRLTSSPHIFFVKGCKFFESAFLWEQIVDAVPIEDLSAIYRVVGPQVSKSKAVYDLLRMIAHDIDTWFSTLPSIKVKLGGNIMSRLQQSLFDEHTALAERTRKYVSCAVWAGYRKLLSWPKHNFRLRILKLPRTLRISFAYVFAGAPQVHPIAHQLKRGRALNAGT